MPDVRGGHPARGALHSRVALKPIKRPGAVAPGLLHIAPYLLESRLVRTRLSKPVVFLRKTMCATSSVYHCEKQIAVMVVTSAQVLVSAGSGKVEASTHVWGAGLSGTHGKSW